MKCLPFLFSIFCVLLMNSSEAATQGLDDEVFFASPVQPRRRSSDFSLSQSPRFEELLRIAHSATWRKPTKRRSSSYIPRTPEDSDTSGYSSSIDGLVPEGSSRCSGMTPALQSLDVTSDSEAGDDASTPPSKRKDRSPHHDTVFMMEGWGLPVPGGKENDLDRQDSIETVLGEPLVRSPLDPAGASFQCLPAPTGLVTPRSPLRTSNATFTFSPAQWAQHLQNLKNFEEDLYKNPQKYKGVKGHMIF